MLLASASPRRKALLEQLGVKVDVIPADIDEQVLAGEAPEHYVERLAIEKARSVAESVTDDCFVVAADTAVVVGNEILGKPGDKDDAVRMLELLSGVTHTVLTGVCVLKNCNDHIGYESSIVKTEVCFTTLSRSQIEAYWQSGEPADKAGAYGIQGVGGRFVQKINGSYSSVVGLPLCETMDLLKKQGYVSEL